MRSDVRELKLEVVEAYEVLDHFITGNDEDLLTTEMLLECRSKVEKSISLLNGYIRYLASRKQEEKVSVSSSKFTNQQIND